MTRSEREQLIERYLDGGMSGPQEESFFIEVAANRELRQELKAYRLVEQGMAEESTAISSASTYTALRAQVQGMLVGTGVGATAGAEHAGSTGGSAAGSAAGSGGGIGSVIGGIALPVKWIVGSLVVAVLGIGTVVLDPFGRQEDRLRGIPAIEQTGKEGMEKTIPVPEAELMEDVGADTMVEEEGASASLPMEVRGNRKGLASHIDSAAGEGRKSISVPEFDKRDAAAAEQIDKKKETSNPPPDWLKISDPKEKK